MNYKIWSYDEFGEIEVYFKNNSSFEECYEFIVNALDPTRNWLIKEM